MPNSGSLVHCARPLTDLVSDLPDQWSWCLRPLCGPAMGGLAYLPGGLAHLPDTPSEVVCGVHAYGCAVLWADPLARVTSPLKACLSQHAN